MVPFRNEESSNLPKLKVLSFSDPRLGKGRYGALFRDTAASAGGGAGRPDPGRGGVAQTRSADGFGWLGKDDKHV